MTKFSSESEKIEFAWVGAGARRLQSAPIVRFGSRSFIVCQFNPVTHVATGRIHLPIDFACSIEFSEPVGSSLNVFNNLLATSGSNLLV